MIKDHQLLIVGGYQLPGIVNLYSFAAAGALKRRWIGVGSFLLTNLRSPSAQPGDPIDLIEIRIK
jgi:hypothetical protein